MRCHVWLLSCCVYAGPRLITATDVGRWLSIGLEACLYARKPWPLAESRLRVYKDILSKWFVSSSETVWKTLHKHADVYVAVLQRKASVRSKAAPCRFGGSCSCIYWFLKLLLFGFFYKPYLEVFFFSYCTLEWWCCSLTVACVCLPWVRPRVWRELCCIKCRAGVFIGKNFQGVCLLFQSLSEC